MLSIRFVVFLLSAFGFFFAARADQHVVIITMDGFPAYLMGDVNAPIPTVRQLAGEGSVAEGMQVSNPAVTWPNHTTLITGAHPAKHSVLFNGVLLRPDKGMPVKVDAKKTKAELTPAVTILELAHQKGLRTAAINWPCTRELADVDDNFPDVPDQITHTTPRLRDELIAAGILSDDKDKSFTSLSSARKDQIWNEAACHVIRKRQPHLLLLHMLVTDGIHHKYGPQTPAGYTAVAQADAQLREIIRALKDAGIFDNTAIFIVADHGFATAEKVLQPNVLLAKHGWINARTPAISQVKAQAVSEGGSAMVYFTDPALTDEDRAKIKALFAGAEGIAEIVEPPRFASLGYPDPAQNWQMADFVLSAKENYAFSNNAVGDHYVIPAEFGVHSKGYHGYLSTNPRMNAVFVAAGKGIRQGQKMPVVENIAVAPTAAKLLGFEIPGADGKALNSILTEN